MYQPAFALRQINEKASMYQVDLSLCFIDFRAAFDSVERDRLYEILRHCGLHVKIVNVIKSSYDGLNCRVKSNGVVGMPLTSELEFVEVTYGLHS